jgi:hypothetical protein|tara:strand:- start:141 stop:413 length:273 start_codon:yes stop_codon:yes gene_type:complete
MPELYMQGLIQTQPVPAEFKECGIKIGAVVHPSGQTDVPGYDTHEKEYQDPCPEKGWNHEENAFCSVLSQEQESHAELSVIGQNNTYDAP